MKKITDPNDFTHPTSSENWQHSNGLTKREHIAICALQGLLVRPLSNSSIRLTQQELTMSIHLAVEAADLLIEKLNEGLENK